MAAGHEAIYESPSGNGLSSSSPVSVTR
jgi:hypothetical protein